MSGQEVKWRRPLVPLFFAYGLCAGMAAGLVEFAAGLIIWSGLIMFVVGIPVIEESARITTLRMIADTPGPRRGDQYRWPAMAFAFGFAGIEKLWHWVRMDFFPLATNALELLFIASPVFMHVVVTFTATMLVILGKVRAAFAVCILIHGVHNIWNTLIQSFSDTVLWIILPVQDTLLLFATIWLFVRWKGAAPEMQLRTSPEETA